MFNKINNIKHLFLQRNLQALVAFSLLFLSFSAEAGLSRTNPIFGDNVAEPGESAGAYASYSGSGCGDTVRVWSSGHCTGSAMDYTGGCGGVSTTATIKINADATQACTVTYGGGASCYGCDLSPDGGLTIIVKLKQYINWISYPLASEAIGKGTVTVVAQGELSNGAVSATTADTKLKFSSETLPICTVTQWGEVTGLNSGTCTITATAIVTDDVVVASSSKSWSFHWPDSDGDGYRDNMDNCPDVANGLAEAAVQGVGNQLDTDGSGVGDACNSARDPDGDEYEYALDNCPADNNPGQENTDKLLGSVIGDACNDHLDSDGDEIENNYDNCRNTANTDQADDDGNGLGNACDIDTDNDGILDAHDNCPGTLNADQADANGDGVGDVCAVDSDGDSIDDQLDNCKLIANTNQLDSNNNGLGNACEVDTDADGVMDDTGISRDNCPLIANANQLDSDFNGVGDVCEMVFVVEGGAGDKNCLSWDHACATINKAVAEAKLLGRTQVFIAKGVYRPATTIALEKGMVLVGGFNGDELYASESRPATNRTVISGDVSGNDLGDVDASGIIRSIDTNNADNLSTILSAAAQGRGYAESIRLQGLVINAANGTGLLVSDSQVNILSSQFVASSGSAIRVEATAVLELGSVDFEANAGSNGSALYITGAGTEVEVKSSRFFNNTATVSGAIFQNASSQLSVVNSSFELNSGTAIAIDGATATINQSSFNTNAAATGGAIRTVGAVTLDVTQSEFNANSAADSGGAIALFSSGTVNISRSLFVDNLATNAGASLFVNQAANNLLVENSTFYANKAGADGGVLQLQSGVANLNYVTMVANTAGGDGGALQRTSGSLSLQRSLLLANTAVGSGDNINNSFTDADYNIVGFNNVGGMTNGAAVSAANSFTATDTPVGEDFSKVAVTLEEILDISPNFGGGDGYYGNLKTMPLLAGSIARDVIPLADCGLSEEDQRGELRPDGKNNACDIGAYEYTVLTCAEDAQRRYKQGEVFVKACTAKLKDFELGTFKPIGLFLLILMGFFRLPRLRQI